MSVEEGEGEEEKEKILTIARLWHKYQHDHRAVHKISREGRVSGRDVGKVKRLIDDGYIDFDANGEPFFTKPPEELEARLEAMKPRLPDRKDQVALEAVEGRVEEHIASEARGNTDMYITLGRVVWEVYADWAAKKGMNLANIEANAPHIAFRRALEKELKYDRLVREYRNLLEALRIYEAEADPLVRLRKAGKLINRFVELAVANEVISEALGTRLIDTKRYADYYSRVLTAYLKGHVE
jgi:hypothetical protein